MRLHYILFILLLCTAYSCKTEVLTPNLNTGDDKIFVQSFLNPTAPRITVGLSVARGVNAKGKKIPKEQLQLSIVNISNGSSTKPLHFEGFISTNIALFAIDASEMPLFPGASYHITIENDSYYSLSASTTIPMDNFSYTYTITGPYNYVDGGEYYKVENTVQDAPFENSFYKSSIHDTSSGYSYSSERFFHDDNGRTPIIKHFLEVDEWILSSGYYHISIANLNEDTYKYLKNIQSVLDNDGNPFAEPTSLHSNVEGGLGIFGAMYNKDTVLRR